MRYIRLDHVIAAFCLLTIGILLVVVIQEVNADYARAVVNGAVEVTP